jgi:hypothetical protein
MAEAMLPALTTVAGLLHAFTIAAGLFLALKMAAGGASAQPVAGGASAELDVPSESEPSLLLDALAGDPLRAIAQLLGDANLPCFRLVCRVFRDHSSPAQMKCRVDFLRTRALTVFAWDSMPGFVGLPPEPYVGLPYMLHLAATVGCEEVLEELVDNRQCPLTPGACDAAAGKGHLDALAWLRSRGCPWDWQSFDFENLCASFDERDLFELFERRGRDDAAFDAVCRLLHN